MNQFSKYLRVGIEHLLCFYTARLIFQGYWMVQLWNVYFCCSQMLALLFSSFLIKPKSSRLQTTSPACLEISYSSLLSICSFTKRFLLHDFTMKAARYAELGKRGWIFHVKQNYFSNRFSDFSKFCFGGALWFLCIYLFFTSFEDQKGIREEDESVCTWICPYVTIRCSGKGRYWGWRNVGKQSSRRK